jgi:low temperature requirement protein LtrA
MPVVAGDARTPRPWLQPPRLRTLEDTPERHASWLELFFDIVVVFAVAYVVLRSLLVGLYVRAYRHVPKAHPLIVRYATGYAAGTVLWLSALAIEEPARFLI